MRAEIDNAIIASADRKFRRKRYLTGEGSINYPESVEREYLRIVDGYVKLASTVMRNISPKSNALRLPKCHPESAWTKSGTFNRCCVRHSRRCTPTSTKKMTFYDLMQKIQKVANQEKKLSIKEWNAVLEKTLGVNVMDDYYNGRYFIEAIERWVEDNANLI